jgi:hypothetical protein
MEYMMLIYQGDALERQAALPEERQHQVYADYQGINQTPGVTPGLPMGLAENATTVRVEGGKALTTDGPFVRMKEAVGGLVHPRGGRHRRGHRGGGPGPGRTLWRRRRDPPLGGVLVNGHDRHCLVVDAMAGTGPTGVPAIDGPSRSAPRDRPHADRAERRVDRAGRAILDRKAGVYL